MTDVEQASAINATRSTVASDDPRGEAAPCCNGFRQRGSVAHGRDAPGFRRLFPSGTLLLRGNPGVRFDRVRFLRVSDRPLHGRLLTPHTPAGRSAFLTSLIASQVVMLANQIASAFLSGPWTEEGLIARGALLYPSAPKKIARFARRVLARFGLEPPLPCLRDLAEFIEGLAELPVVGYRSVLKLPRPVMWRGTGPAVTWHVPDIITPGELAEWLGVSIGRMEWFADCRGLETKVADERLRQYRYRWVAKRTKGNGGGMRLLEIPKRRLRAIQRRVLHGILDGIPPHRAAHAFCSRRSLMSSVAPHCGRDVVLRMDLADFFPSIPASRVMALFRTAGYPEAVARLLTGLCTNSVPGSAAIEETLLDGRFRQPHLPQGAPTSPGLANLCAYHLDNRLQGLARCFGCSYTRYADDLLFSGHDALLKNLSRFRIWVQTIALTEGFTIRHSKTRILRAGHRQEVSGIVLNEHPNPPRTEFDSLRALLHNCARFGPDSQNREAHPRYRDHLAGRIAWFRQINPRKAERLVRLFSLIRWD
jgi:RNA-directed DNA polymerase